MCAIAGIVSLNGSPVPELKARLAVMAKRIAHRGPDGEGFWIDPSGSAGLAHRRLAIIDLSETGAQPMAGANGCQIVHNGEIYNYPELRTELEGAWPFRSRSDTETILAAHDAWADDAPLHLRGMWAYALWNPARSRLFASRDRFGIKPFYYAQIGSHLYFASEIKAILPFLAQIDVNPAALAEYLTFQFTLGGDTLVKGIRQLPAAHNLIVENGTLREERYWDVQYKIDRGRPAEWFHERLTSLTEESVRLHMRADTDVGSYLSGGLDSSLVALLATRQKTGRLHAFHGAFRTPPGFDESEYARIVADTGAIDLHEMSITADDFRTHIFDVIRHLDEPIAGPGSFPQFMTAKFAASKVKVVLGGQGGDEIFGGYARYIIAYFEQCIKAAIDGTYKNGNFVVTIESIVPQLPMLHEYKPLLKTFWAEGLFDELDARYFRLINRSVDMNEEIEWADFPSADVFDAFRSAFHGRNVGKEAYFDKMTHFDFKHLLPALLHVEDRMSMAHGLESRVPFLDHPLVEFAATAPADVKFSGGRSKQMLKAAFQSVLPAQIANRRDKMGFPVPLAAWFKNELRELVGDVFGSTGAGELPYLKPKAVRHAFGNGQPFSRKTWGLLSLELWRKQMQDEARHRFSG